MTTSPPTWATFPDEPEGLPDSREAVADHARTIVVPIANPDTVTDLLRVANALLPSEGGRIIACVIETSEADAEQRGDVLEGLGDLVDVLRSRMPNTSIELRNRNAVSVTRGVLDAVRDNGADTLVLGVRSRKGGSVELGPITEALITSAPCDVVVHRSLPDRDLSEVQRVVVAVDGTRVARTTVRAGILLGNELRRPVDVVHVAKRGTSRAEAEDVVRRSLLNVEGSAACDADLLFADQVAPALAEHLQATDLLVVGFGSEESSTGWRAGSTTRSVLDEEDLPVVGIARRTPAPTGALERLRRVSAWLHPRLTDVEQTSVRSDAEASAGLTLDYVLMTLASAAIATFGILLDSSAVIIGAMLVAPLMAPLQAFGIGMVAARTRVAAKAALTTLQGILIALAFAIVAGWVVGTEEPTVEMLARGSPSMIDAAVAVAAGAAGAYATARKGIPAALAGVAIAAALVPPISVTGLAVAMGRPALALGAGLLFSVNMVFIAAVTAGVFWWLGLKPSRRDRAEEDHGRWWLGLGGLAVVLVAAILSLQGSRTTISTDDLEDALLDVVDGIQLIEVERARTVDDTVIRVVVEVPEDVAAAESGERAIAVDAEVEEAIARAARAELREQLGDDITVRLSVQLVREF